MSDTIDSSIGDLQLEEGRRGRASAASDRASDWASDRASAASSRRRTALDMFFEDEDAAAGANTAGGAGAGAGAGPSAILYARESDSGRDAARAETRKMEAMENEIFNLKLKITLLEKSAKLGADSKELYTQLTATHASQRKLEAENAALRARLDGDKSARVEQEEMLTTFLEAQDEYSRLCDGILEVFRSPELCEYAPAAAPGGGEDVPIDEKLGAIEQIVANLLTALEDAQENYMQVEELIRGYLGTKTRTEAELHEARSTIESLRGIFKGVPSTLLVDSVLGLVNNNAALEQQIQKHHDQKDELEQELEQLQAKLPLDIHGENERLHAENAKLMDAVSRASARSYDITRQFFRRLTAYMGPEWGEENDKRLRQIMEESKRQSRSKLPLLVELMMQCVDEMAMMARGAEVLPGENAELEEKVRYLEDLLTQELTRMGADKVLLAKYKDLEQRLKVETEKRKNEYIGYQRSLTNLSLQ